MKKNFFLKLVSVLATIALCTDSIKAQVDWNLGGNTPAANEYFGTSNNTDIRICTDNGGVNFDIQKQKMIISALGDVGIGKYDGANNPTFPQNKLLVRNGSAAADPYDPAFLTLLGGILTLAPQEISLYTFSDKPTGFNDNNVALYSVAKDADFVNIGGLYNVSGGSNSPINIANALIVTGNSNGSTSANSDNKGVFVFMPEGDGADNEGVEIVIEGSNADNDAISVDIIGDGSINTALDAQISGNNADNNTGVVVDISGSSTNYNGGARISISGTSQGNAGYNAYITGTGVYNTGCYYEVSGGTSGNNGVQAHVSGSTAPINTIMYGTSTGATNTNNGIDLRVNGNNTTPYGNGALVQTSGATNGNIAGHFIAENGSAVTIGVIGEVATPGTNLNYGVYGDYAVSGNNGTDYAGYFNGDVFSATNFYTSDPKLKENIKEYKGALEQLSKINIKKYTYRTNEFPGMNLPQGEQVGLLSTNLKEVFPNLVKQAIYPGSLRGKEDIKFDAVNTNALVPVLVQAVKELDAKNVSTDEMKKEIEALKADKAAVNKELEAVKTDNETLKKDMADMKEMLDKICSNGCGDFKPASTLGGTTGSESGLFQNVPNPFNNTTVIPYTIGQGVKQAVLVITNLNGNELKRFATSQTGAGTFEINMDEFGAGTYVYSLFTDGKLIDTKKMVLTGK